MRTIMEWKMDIFMWLVLQKHQSQGNQVKSLFITSKSHKLPSQLLGLWASVCLFTPHPPPAARVLSSDICSRWRHWYIPFMCIRKALSPPHLTLSAVGANLLESYFQCPSDPSPWIHTMFSGWIELQNKVLSLTPCKHQVAFPVQPNITKMHFSGLCLILWISHINQS